MIKWLILLCTIGGCAWYGSSGKIYNRNIEKGDILVIFHRSTYSNYSDDLLFNKEIISALKKQTTGIRFQYLNQDYTPKAFHASENFNEYRNTVKGFLFVNSSYRANYVDLEVELLLYNSDFEKILQARHNTFWGNSYFMPPSKEQTSHDAAHGVVRKFSRKLERIH